MEDNEDYNKLIKSLTIGEMDNLLIALDMNEQENPHGDDFEVDDRDIESHFLDFEQEKQYKKEVKDLADYPDYSDEVINDYLMNRLKGIEKPVPQIVDLDTAPNYVDFVNISIKNMLDFENQFNERSQFERLRELLSNQ